jgi:hypothetical protein
VVLDRHSIDGLALIRWFVIWPVSLGLSYCVALEGRPLSVALPVAAATAAATPAAAARALTGFAFTELIAFLI